MAGTPNASFQGGTSLVTIAPAATIAPSPSSIPGKIVVFAPIEAPFLIIGPRYLYALVNIFDGLIIAARKPGYIKHREIRC